MFNIQEGKISSRQASCCSGGLLLLPFELPEPPFPEEVEEDEVVVALSMLLIIGDAGM